MNQTKPRPLRTILKQLIRSQLLFPILIATVVVISFASYLGGQQIQNQQLNLSRSIAHNIHTFLLLTSNELIALSEVAQSNELDTVAAYMKANRMSHGIFDTFYLLNSSNTFANLWWKNL